MENLSHVSLYPNKEDLRLWNDPPSYTFSVKSAYNKLIKQASGGVSGVFEYLWNLKVMPSAQFYVWRALSNRIATKMNLHKRGVLLGDTICVLCGREEDSTSHILVTCDVSTKVWNMCFNWTGISSVDHNDLIHHFEQFSCMCFNQEGDGLWKSLWVSVVWCILKHRNKVIFNQTKIDAEEIFTMAQLQTWVWMKHKERKVKFSFSDWILSPLTCINMATK